jgi:pimeloyl-ACP methyl ester carboxylesterase
MFMTENISFTNSQSLKLYGTLVVPDKDVKDIIIIMSHGFMADREERGIFTEAADLFRKSGFPSFRFDFSGSGQSDTTAITVSKHVDDLCCAVDRMLKKGFTSVGLLGYSLGGLYSFLAYNKRVKTIVAWAPVTDSKVPTKLKDESVQRELEDKGYTRLTNKQGKLFTIEKTYLSQRLAVNQKEMMSKITCPVLIIHGSDDTTVPVTHSHKAMDYLSDESRLWVIDQCAHDFADHHDVLLTLSQQWFVKNLKSDS